MEFKIKQISSLEKVMDTFPEDYKETTFRKALAGERVNYQINIASDMYSHTVVSYEAPFDVKIYSVKDVFADKPFGYNADKDGYLLSEPGMIPDVLVPIEDQNGYISTRDTGTTTLWVTVDIPEKAKAGKYDIKVKFAAAGVSAAGLQPEYFFRGL